MVDGRFVMRDRKILTVDEDAHHCRSGQGRTARLGGGAKGQPDRGAAPDAAQLKWAPAACQPDPAGCPLRASPFSSQASPLLAEGVGFPDPSTLCTRDAHALIVPSVPGGLPRQRGAPGPPSGVRPAESGGGATIVPYDRRASAERRPPAQQAAVEMARSRRAVYGLTDAHVVVRIGRARRPGRFGGAVCGPLLGAAPGGTAGTGAAREGT